MAELPDALRLRRSIRKGVGVGIPLELPLLNAAPDYISPMKNIMSNFCQHYATLAEID